MYVPVKAIEVFIWGHRVGVLTHDYDQYFVFEYDPRFRKTGIITDDDLLLVAERFGIGTAKRALKEIEEVLA